MITEWIVGLWYGLQDWFLDLAPDWQVPQQLLDLDQTVSAFFDNFEGLGVWADWAFLVLMVGLVTLSWLTALGIRIARAVASYLIPGWGAA